MHIILLKFADNRSAAPHYMQAHNAWVARGVADGVFQCVGSLDIGGGFILAHGESDDDLSKRVSEDPFVENSIVTANVHQIDVKHTSEQLAHLRA